MYREATPVAEHQPAAVEPPLQPVLPPARLALNQPPMEAAPSVNKLYKPVPDTEFDLLMDAIERVKRDKLAKTEQHQQNVGENIWGTLASR